MRLSQTKLKRKADGEEEKLLSSRPAWVVDHNLCHLWSKGLDESMIPVGTARVVAVTGQEADKRVGEECAPNPFLRFPVAVNEAALP